VARVPVNRSITDTDLVMCAPLGGNRFVNLIYLIYDCLGISVSYLHLGDHYNSLHCHAAVIPNADSELDNGRRPGVKQLQQ